MENQFQKHDINNQKSIGEFALNDFSKPEGIFIYGNRGSEQEFTVDLDIKRINNGTAENPIYEEHVVGAQMLCPRCSSPLYVKGKTIPNGSEIVVHWDLPIRSDVDGLKRPPISIDGVIGCDYYDFEINGTSKNRNSNVSLKCGWKGGIIGGQCFDHTSVAIADYNASLLKKQKEDALEEKSAEDMIKDALNDPNFKAMDFSKSDQKDDEEDIEYDSNDNTLDDVSDDESTDNKTLSEENVSIPEIVNICTPDKENNDDNEEC